MSGCLTFPATIPVRNVTEAELAAAVRASLPLQAAQRLADWFGDGPVDAQSAGVRHMPRPGRAARAGWCDRSPAVSTSTMRRGGRGRPTR
jgi:hypothetical protein